MAQEAKIVNAVTFNMGFYPMVQEARKMVADGNIGEFQLAYGRQPQAMAVELAIAFLSGDQAADDQLSRWERYAQVLLGSNEFIYLD